MEDIINTRLIKPKIKQFKILLGPYPSATMMTRKYATIIPKVKETFNVKF